ncbi:MAG: hypothetical protein KatS3mg087_0090 [Patescibacteria group bacterium]|nr:MAG: hypothetical protein KatS3mg087_0090 [Patescibacteria group bacterium]
MIRASQFILGKNEFYSYVIAANIADGVYLYWQPSQELLVQEPLIHAVYRSLDPDENWEEIAVNLNDTFYEDHPPLITDALPYYYKIKTTGLKGIYESPVVSNIGRPSKRYELLANRILRRLLNLPISDAKGYLLSRKISGEHCSVCYDNDLNISLRSDCTECYGTGFVGGYIKLPFEIRLLARTPISIYGPIQDPRQQVGMLNVTNFRGKLAGFPIIKPFDAFVSSSDLRRYYIANANTSAEIGGIPVVFDVEMRLAESNDILQKFPL